MVNTTPSKRLASDTDFDLGEPSPKKQRTENGVIKFQELVEVVAAMRSIAAVISEHKTKDPESGMDEVLNRVTEAERALEEARNKPLQAVVYGPPGQGKSRMINKLLGQDIVPSHGVGISGTLATIKIVHVPGEGKEPIFIVHPLSEDSFKTRCETLFDENNLPEKKRDQLRGILNQYRDNIPVNCPEDLKRFHIMDMNIVEKIKERVEPFAVDHIFSRLNRMFLEQDWSEVLKQAPEHVQRLFCELEATHFACLQRLLSCDHIEIRVSCPSLAISAGETGFGDLQRRNVELWDVPGAGDVFARRLGMAVVDFKIDADIVFLFDSFDIGRYATDENVMNLLKCPYITNSNGVARRAHDLPLVLLCSKLDHVEEMPYLRRYSATLMDLLSDVIKPKSALSKHALSIPFVRQLIANMDDLLVPLGTSDLNGAVLRETISKFHDVFWLRSQLTKPLSVINQALATLDNKVAYGTLSVKFKETFIAIEQKLRRMPAQVADTVSIGNAAAMVRGILNANVSTHLNSVRRDFLNEDGHLITGVRENLIEKVKKAVKSSLRDSVPSLMWDFYFPRIFDFINKLHDTKYGALSIDLGDVVRETQWEDLSHSISAMLMDNPDSLALAQMRVLVNCMAPIEEKLQSFSETRTLFGKKGFGIVSVLNSIKIPSGESMLGQYLSDCIKAVVEQINKSDLLEKLLQRVNVDLKKALKKEPATVNIDFTSMRINISKLKKRVSKSARHHTNRTVVYFEEEPLRPIVDIEIPDFKKTPRQLVSCRIHDFPGENPSANRILLDVSTEKRVATLNAYVPPRVEVRSLIDPIMIYPKRSPDISRLRFDMYPWKSHKSVLDPTSLLGSAHNVYVFVEEHRLAEYMRADGENILKYAQQFPGFQPLSKVIWVTLPNGKEGEVYARACMQLFAKAKKMPRYWYMSDDIRSFTRWNKEAVNYPLVNITSTLTFAQSVFHNYRQLVQAELQDEDAENEEGANMDLGTVSFQNLTKMSKMIDETQDYNKNTKYYDFNVRVGFIDKEKVVLINTEAMDGIRYIPDEAFLGEAPYRNTFDLFLTECLKYGRMDCKIFSVVVNYY